MSRMCPECEREMWHWQCRCGFRTPKPTLRRPAQVASHDGHHCPECERPLEGDTCRCGYSRPARGVAVAVSSPAQLTAEQRQRGMQQIEQLRARLRGVA